VNESPYASAGSDACAFLDDRLGVDHESASQTVSISRSVISGKHGNVRT
jgi:hypothetical protein